MNILFVCMGNICRSPTAEAVMKSVVKREGLEKNIKIDSAGTIAYHTGEQADRRMKAHAIKRGYNLTSISRKISRQDWDDFDMIIAMDNDNLKNLLKMPGANPEKLSKLTDYIPNSTYDEVPDPYYGGPMGFEQVIDIVELGCNGLIEKLKLEGI